MIENTETSLPSREPRSLQQSVRRIRRRILEDVTNRNGWRQEYAQFATRIKREINKSWDKIIAEELGKMKPNAKFSDAANDGGKAL